VGMMQSACGFAAADLDGRFARHEPVPPARLLATRHQE
jgi:hypothetical protein